jgi:Zn-dependent protease with chaperone function
MERLRQVVSHRAIAVIAALALSAGVADAQTKIKSGFNLFSAQDDVQVGAQSAQEAERQLPILNDAATQNYVDRIGQRLAQNAGGPQFQYRFRVVNASDINAFALPGGFVYINRGILEQARNEGEVAGVIAHEISHVALRHGTHQASKAYLAQAGLSILGGVLGGKVGEGAAQVINAVGGFGMNALFLKFSRDLESQADIRGSQILAASGYSPQDMIGFFQTLERVDKSKKTNFLSDHPAPPDRIKRIEKEATLLHVSPTPTTNVADLQQIQRGLGRYGAAPTMAQIAQGNTPQTSASNTGRTRSAGSGAVSVNVPAPSNTLRSYTSPSGVYRISFPSNWEVYQEGSTGVTLAPSGGIGNTGNTTDIVYGAIINHYDPFGNASASSSRLRGSSPNGGYYGTATIEDATNDLLNTIVRSSPYLRVSGRGQRINAGGATALAQQLRGVDPNTGIDERVTLVTRQLADDHLIYLLFITPERDASRYGPVLNAMVSSLQVAEGHAH